MNTLRNRVERLETARLNNGTAWVIRPVPDGSPEEHRDGPISCDEWAARYCNQGERGQQWD